MKIILALLIFSAIILFHELGHFLLAKKNKIVVTEFSLGMGPRLLSTEKNGTRYSLKLLPLGGSCAMLGEDMEDESKGTFNGAPVWGRIATVAAGPVFNFILAFVFAVLIVTLVGYDPAEVTQVESGSTVAEAGLQEGDIINVDVSTIYNGYYSDASRMFCIGQVSDEARRLVDVTKECVEIGISMVKPWTCLGDMGHAVHEHALKNGYTIVPDIGGHGVGLEFHEEPWVSYVTLPDTEMLMVPGMIFTIEPMVNMGTDEVFVDADNDWTVYTDDGQLSAQWEVTVLVTEDGCEVLAW